MKPLTITIHDHRKVFAVREEFSRAFPDLKLEFHARPHTSDGPASPKLVRDSNAEIGNCRTNDKKGTMTISLGMTVGEVQDYFRDTYGLEVELWHRSGDEWEPADLRTPLDALSNEGQKPVISGKPWG